MTVTASKNTKTSIEPSRAAEVSPRQSVLTREGKEVYIIHTPDSLLGASWVKQRLERYGKNMVVYTSDDMGVSFTDIGLLQDFLVDRCERGAICLFYVSRDCGSDEAFNMIKDRMLMYRVHKNNKCLAPVWDDDYCRKNGPNGLCSFQGVSVQSTRLVECISVLFRNR